MNLLRTCRKIRTIMKNFFVKNKFLRIQKRHNIGPKEFRIMTKDAVNLKFLSTSGCTWLYDELLGPVLKRNQKLNHLDLSHSLKCSSAVFQVNRFLALKA